MSPFRRRKITTPPRPNQAAPCHIDFIARYGPLSYDAAGNIFADNMTAENQFASPTTFRYDSAGNMTQTGVASYTYNAENQMAQASTGTTTGYVYDGDGNRVEKLNSSGAATKLYWYSGGNALDETDGTGAMTTTNPAFNEYVFFGGKRIARRNSSGVYYYVEDHLGTSREIVQAGQTAACYDADFYPFGGELQITTTCSQNYKFEGKERDSLAENGNLDNFGARFDASAMGRFMSPDWSASPEAVPYAKLDDPQSLNLYTYTRNNPVTLTDPDGHCWSWIQAVCNAFQRVYYWSFTDFGFKTHTEVVKMKRDYLIKQQVEINGERRDYTRASDKQVEEDWKKVDDAWKNKTLSPYPITPGGIPPDAQRTLETIDQTGKPPAGIEGGQTFQNDGRGGGEALPRTDANGNPISYREWDVNPSGGGARGAERIVTGSDGSAYYTSDHYQTFTKIR